MLGAPSVWSVDSVLGASDVVESALCHVRVLGTSRVKAETAVVKPGNASLVFSPLKK